MSQERHRSNRHLFALAGVLGVLAFVFSAVSPYDDEIQHEFFRRPETRQFVVQNCKLIRDIRISVNGLVPHALARRSLVCFRGASVEQARVFDVEIRAAIFCSQAGSRSPPTRSSLQIPSENL